MQNNKITKLLMKLFFNNPNLISIQEYLIYKNIDKSNVFLIKLSYDKVTQ